MYRIAVIGRGHVGQALIRDLEGTNHMVSYDRTDGTPYPIDSFRDCDLGVICVDTPAATDGSADVGNVEDAVAAFPGNTLIIRSTVPPGTTARLATKFGKEICFWPEYVGEAAFVGSSWEAFRSHEPFIVIGGESKVRSQVIDILLSSLGPEVRIFSCSSDEAEMIKYVENAYFATKVGFVSELRELCQAIGVEWHTVREGWLLDPRVERDHTAAFLQNPGFGGKCLPKDLTALLSVGGTVGLELPVLSAVRDANLLRRPTGPDLGSLTTT